MNNNGSITLNFLDNVNLSVKDLTQEIQEINLSVTPTLLSVTLTKNAAAYWVSH